jgi:hypothetical protein
MLNSVVSYTRLTTYVKLVEIPSLVAPDLLVMRFSIWKDDQTSESASSMVHTIKIAKGP